MGANKLCWSKSIRCTGFKSLTPSVSKLFVEKMKAAPFYLTRASIVPLSFWSCSYLEFDCTAFSRHHCKHLRFTKAPACWKDGRSTPWLRGEREGGFIYIHLRAQHCSINSTSRKDQENIRGPTLIPQEFQVADTVWEVKPPLRH